MAVALAVDDEVVGERLDRLHDDGGGERGVGDVTRLFTMSVSDLLNDWFESDAIKAMLTVNGVIGTWVGPDEPGTAYVMLHHSIGDVGDGHLGSWGFQQGGMGAVSDSIRSAAEAFGDDGGVDLHGAIFERDRFHELHLSLVIVSCSPHTSAGLRLALGG